MQRPCPYCGFQKTFSFEPKWCLNCGKALTPPQPPISNNPMDIPLPIIQPNDWPGQEKTANRSLCFMPRLAGTPWLALYYQTDSMKAYVGPERLQHIGKRWDQVEQEAINNVARVPASWRFGRFPAPGAEQPLEMLRCIDEPFASERILERPFLETAQMMLRSRELAGAIPQRGMLLVTKFGDARMLMTIAQHYYDSAGDARLTPWVFALINGDIAGRFFEENGQLGVDAVVMPPQ